MLTHLLLTGIGARRVEISEDHKIYHQSYVYFKAGGTPTHTSHRRTLSVGPGLHLDSERDIEPEHDDDDSDESSDRGHSTAEERRGRDPVRGQQRGRPPRRLSADQTNFQTNFVSHYNEQLPTPPYSPMYSPAMTPLRRSPAPSRAPSIITPIHYEDPSAHSLEEFRRDHSSESRDHSRGRARGAEFWEVSGSRDRFSSGQETPGIYSPTDGSLSRRVSLEEQQRPEFVLGSSTGRTQSAPVPPYSPTRNNSHDGQSPHPLEDGRGRSKGSRLSSLGMFFDAVKERVRSVSRAERDYTPSHSRSRDARDLSPDRRDPSGRRGRTREPKERSTLERVTEVLGLESDDENESGDGWKEFKKGA